VGAEIEEVRRTAGEIGTFTSPPDGADAIGCQRPVSPGEPGGRRLAIGFYSVTLTAAGAEADCNVAHAGFVVGSAIESTRQAVLVLATTFGTTDWTFGLANDPRVGRVTANILDMLVRPLDRTGGA
jgi:hypothetical protein